MDHEPVRPDGRDRLGAGDLGAGDGVRPELARRLAKLPPFHPSSTAEAARATHRADDRMGPRDGQEREEAARQDGRADRREGDGPAETAPRDDGESRPGIPADDRSADRPEVDYWGRVKEFELLWERHVERWPRPAENAGQDSRLPGDPAGSWRGDGGRYLSPEQNAEAGRLIAGLREPEKEVTALMLAIERENSFGGRLAGLDHRIKADQRLKEKIVDKLGVKVDSSPADAVTTINDAVRYTFCFDQSVYVSGYGDIKQRLEAAGYEMMRGKNRWISDPQYKGINTKWVTPTGGRFELQFHTEESLHAKMHLTHNSYERLRSRVTSWAERLELGRFQRMVSAAIPEPIGISTIPEHQRRS